GNRIRRNSEARIVTQGLLGDKLVEISIGSADAPPLEPGEHLIAREPFEMDRVFAEGADTLANVNRLARALTSTVEQIHRGGAPAKLNPPTPPLRGPVHRP